LRAVQIVIDEGIARPVLIGREDVITARIKSFGLRMKLGADVECINVNDDARYNEVWNQYYRLTARKGVTRSIAKAEVRTRPTLIGAMLIRRGDVDSMLCGTYGNFGEHLQCVRDVIGLRPGVKTLAAMNMLILPGRQLFICD